MVKFLEKNTSLGVLNIQKNENKFQEQVNNLKNRLLLNIKWYKLIYKKWDVCVLERITMDGNAKIKEYRLLLQGREIIIHDFFDKKNGMYFSDLDSNLILLNKSTWKTKNLWKDITIDPKSNWPYIVRINWINWKHWLIDENWEKIIESDCELVEQKKMDKNNIKFFIEKDGKIWVLDEKWDYDVEIDYDNVIIMKTPTRKKVLWYQVEKDRKKWLIRKKINGENISWIDFEWENIDCKYDEVKRDSNYFVWKKWDKFYLMKLTWEVISYIDLEWKKIDYYDKIERKWDFIALTKWKNIGMIKKNKRIIDFKNWYDSLKETQNNTFILKKWEVEYKYKYDSYSNTCFLC